MYVLHFMDECIEDFSYGTLILILSLIHGQKHVSCEYDGYMRGQCIIGKTVTFRFELEKQFSCFEKDFDVPSLVVD